MHAFDDARLCELMDERAGFGAICGRIDKLDLARSRDAHFGVAVDIAVGVTGNRDRLLPVGNDRLDALDDDGGTEDRAVEHGTDRAVRALPHLVEVVLLHAGCVWCDCRALDGDAQALRCLCCIDRDLVFGLVPVLESEVIVFGLEVHERLQKLILDELPYDAGHLVAVHLDKRRLHLDLCHVLSFEGMFKP